MQGFLGGDGLTRVIAAQVDVELTIREAVVYLMGPTERQRCLASPSGTRDHADGDNMMSALFIGDDRVEGVQFFRAIDETPNIARELLGSRITRSTIGLGFVVMEVNPTANTARLDDIA